MMLDTNFTAVIVATIVSLAFATVWYSPYLFGTVWLRSIGSTSSDMRHGSAESWIRLGAAFVVHCIALFLVTSLFKLSSIARVESPLVVLGKIAVIVSLFSASLVIWERKPFVYFLVHGGYLCAALVGGGAIIMYWPW